MSSGRRFASSTKQEILENCWKMKTRKAQKDRLKSRRNCSTNTLKRKTFTNRTTNYELAQVLKSFLCGSAKRWIFKTMYNKTIIRFGFCDIRNNQGRGKCYQSKPKAEADNTYLDLDYSGYHKNFI